MITNTKLSTQGKKKKSGFTLIEVIAVLVLLGILAAIALPKYTNMAAEARQTAITAGMAELNSREALVWGKEALKAGGWTIDVMPSTVLGTDYDATGIAAGSGDLIFQTTTTVGLTRVGASLNGPGVWSRTPVTP